MPLPLPILDDRRWASDVEEGRAQISHVSRSWTDHNAHDPGITLIELFAWLAETVIFRLDQVPERHRRKFLALIGFHPHGPRVSYGFLSFTPDPGTRAFPLPVGTVFETAESAREPIPFRTANDIGVVAARIVTVLVDTGEESSLSCGPAEMQFPIAAFGPDPRPGAMLYLGLDQPLPSARDLPDGKPVSIGFFFLGDKSSRSERARLLEEARSKAEECRRPRPAIDCEGGAGVETQGAPADLSLPAHHGARIEWQYFAAEDGGKWRTLRPDLGEVVDDTRALTLDGKVRLALPTEMEATTVGRMESKLYFLRAGLARGSQYDAAPLISGIVLNAVDVEQAVPGWQTLEIAGDATVQGTAPLPGALTQLNFRLDTQGRVSWLEFLAEDPDHPRDQPRLRVLEFQAPDTVRNTPGEITMEAVWLGIGASAPSQRLVVPGAPIVAETLALYTIEDGNIWRLWTRRMDLDASRRDDSHYTLNPTTGEVVFGDGERGSVPDRISAPEHPTQLIATYQTTRGAGGNIPAGRSFRLAVDELPRESRWSPLNKPVLDTLRNEAREQLARIVASPVPATGGADSEGLESAIGRAVETLWAHERLQSLSDRFARETLDQISPDETESAFPPTRAINTLDIERLALDVPGTIVRRARAWSNVHPDYPCRTAYGVVTLAIVPELPLGRPRPSQGLREMVRRYLDRRRIVTTRIEVVGPRYVALSVRAKVQRCQGVDSERLVGAIHQALNRFFDPLRGGPEGFGWPLGRDVYRSEVLEVIDKVDGVDHVVELVLDSDGGELRCGNLCLGPTSLVTLGHHQIEVI